VAKGWILLYENAQVHRLVLVQQQQQQQQQLTKHGSALLLPPTILSHLAPCNFYLFPQT